MLINTYDCYTQTNLAHITKTPEFGIYALSVVIGERQFIDELKSHSCRAWLLVNRGQLGTDA